MSELRGYFAWVALGWALRLFHPRDPMRARCAEFIVAMAQWQRRYDTEALERRALRRQWAAKVKGQ